MAMEEKQIRRPGVRKATLFEGSRRRSVQDSGHTAGTELSLADLSCHAFSCHASTTTCLARTSYEKSWCCDGDSPACVAEATKAWRRKTTDADSLQSAWELTSDLRSSDWTQIETTPDGCPASCESTFLHSQSTNQSRCQSEVDEERPKLRLPARRNLRLTGPACSRRIP